MSDNGHTAPLLTGRKVTLRDLEAAFGPCPGVLLQYGEGEFGRDGKLRWCAATLANDGMVKFVAARHASGQDGPFLIAMGSLKRAASRGGVGKALYGFALADDTPLPATELLWPDQLSQPNALNEAGEFRWKNGVPFLRVWLCPEPVPFVKITGIEPDFQRHHGSRVVPFEQVVAGLTEAMTDLELREVVLDRPTPLPAAAMHEIEVNEGALKYRLTGVRERDPKIVRAALDANRLRYGAYTCEDCGYQPASDKRVPNRLRRNMLDVHHVEFLALGERKTRIGDLLVMCPLCHRREHVIHRAASGATANAELQAGAAPLRQ